MQCTQLHFVRSVCSADCCASRTAVPALDEICASSGGANCGVLAIQPLAVTAAGGQPFLAASFWLWAGLPWARVSAPAGAELQQVT